MFQSRGISTAPFHPSPEKPPERRREESRCVGRESPSAAFCSVLLWLRTDACNTHTHTVRKVAEEPGAGSRPEAGRNLAEGLISN